MEFCRTLVFFGIAASACVLMKTSAYRTNCEFPAIFNFGDSNSDTGGISAAFGQAGLPHGQTYFNAPSGRYCDGRLIIDFIAESLGFPYLSAFLDALGSNFKHGANFATAGSTVRPQNTTKSQSGLSPFSLDVQSRQFTDFHRRSQIIRTQGGDFSRKLPKSQDISRALYTFDIGQNDLTAGYFSTLTPLEDVARFVPDVISQFKTAVQSIYDEGGRSFWIHNTGPIGCLPYVMDRFTYPLAVIDEVGCDANLNKAAQIFNLKLKEAVAELRVALPFAAITYVDVYSAKYDLISKAHEYGFEEALRACCGQGGKHNYSGKFGCGKKTKEDGKEIILVNACNNTSTAINWDGIHYTEAANKWVFNKIVDGSFSDPPIPLNLACNTHPHPHPHPHSR